MRACGELVLRSQLESMIEILDAHLFLEGPRADAERARQRAAFLAAPTRPAFLAGRSYDGEPDGLAAALAGHFEAPGGPGPIGPPRDVRVHGLVAPHIDFNRGGPAYAWAYRALAEARDADCFIVVGTAHAGLDGHSFAATAKAFETPFGPLEVDREVLDAVARRAPADLFAAELAHRGEHSIEFQAVWLRYLAASRGRGRAPDRAAPRELRPRVPASRQEPRGPAGDRRGAGRPPGRDGDRPAPLLHRGGRGSGPRRPALRRRVAGRPRRSCARVESEDRALLAPVVRADAEGFFAEALRQQDRNRICGLSPIYALLRLLPGGAGRLLHYGQWPDPDGAVTFASVSFEQRRRPGDPARARDRRRRGAGSRGRLPDRPRGCMAPRRRRGHPPGRPAEPLREPPGRRGGLPPPGGAAPRPGARRRRPVRRRARRDRCRAGASSRFI